MSQSPFPGMDPYLEAPELWPDVHESLMNIFREQLTPRLVPKYLAELNTQIVIDRILPEPSETRTVLPDVSVTQPDEAQTEGGPAVSIAPAPLRLTVPVAVPTRLVSIYIRRREADRVVTVIELLSPINKRPGPGREDYLKKRDAFLESEVHLVEIDLLRQGPRMPLGGPVPDSPYLAMVSLAQERPQCDVWPIEWRQPLPVLPVPLLPPDPPAPLDLGQALQTAYQRARYDLRIDYATEPTPPLPPAEAAWAAALLEEAG